METIHKEERARAQAGAQLASIAELVTCLQHAEVCNDTACGADCPHDVDEAREAIMGDALDVQVRGEWHTPGAIGGAAPYEYKILLCWGGRRSSATTLIMNGLEFGGQELSKRPDMIGQSSGHAGGLAAPLGLDQS